MSKVQADTICQYNHIVLHKGSILYVIIHVLVCTLIASKDGHLSGKISRDSWIIDNNYYICSLPFITKTSTTSSSK